MKKNMLVWGVLLSLCLGVLPVYADANPRITLVNAPDQDRSAVMDLCSDINESIQAEELLSDSAFLIEKNTREDVVIEVNMSAYRSNLLSVQDRQKIMQIALQSIQNSRISRTNRNKIFDELCALDSTTANFVRQLSDDVQSDFAGAYAVFKPFSGFFGWVLGMLTLGMFLVLGLSMVFDIAYINLPFVQLLLERDEEGREASKKPMFVSLEAHSAVREADSKAGISYVSPNSLYLKQKGKQFVMVSICILYLCSGQIYIIAGKCIDYFREILKLLF